MVRLLDLFNVFEESADASHNDRVFRDDSGNRYINGVMINQDVFVGGLPTTSK